MIETSIIARRIRDELLDVYPKCTVAIYPAGEDYNELITVLVRPKSRLRQVRDFIENMDSIPIEIDFEVFAD